MYANRRRGLTLLLDNDIYASTQIYRLVRASPVKELRAKAKALNLGAEAMRRMNLGSKSNVNPRNLVS